MPKSVTEYVLTSQRPSYAQPLTVKGSFLFLSDFEIPFQNAAFINNVFAVTQAYGVKQCVWAGDAMHFEAFSPFPGGDQDAEQELTEIDEYLPGFLEPFERITYFMGNHDDRPMRAMQRKISAEKALRMIVAPETTAVFHQKVTMSEYYWCLASYGWRLTHAKNNGMMPAATAKRLAEKYQAHIVHAHTHKLGMVHDVSGNWLAIESGCGVDTTKLAYANLRDNTHTAMVNGAVLMLDTGRQYSPLLLNKFTDWQYEAWRAGKLKAHL